MRIILLVALSVSVYWGNAQTTSITYETNDLDSLVVNNPFKNFIGEWTLKNDSWTQNWGGETETIKIPGHHTVVTAVNTKNSLLQIIDGPPPNGHIFWSYNPVTKAVHHLSSFGELRAGVGEGRISESGNVTLKINFEGEPKDYYRIYNYTWLSQDEYNMKSVQYDANDHSTGLFYEGNFVRLPNHKMTLKNQIETILSVLDNQEISIEEQLEVYADDVVHMAPGSEVNLGKVALEKYLQEQRQYGKAKMKHRIVELEQFNNMVLMRGEVTGTFHPKGKAPSAAFRTKNLFVFDSSEGALKIKKVIYNASPLK